MFTTQNVMSFLDKDLTAQSTLLDQRQAALETMRPFITEDTAWQIQADIDRDRFVVGFDMLEVKLSQSYS